MELEKQLLCPVCLEMFSKPVVILPCQHNLCRKCASDVLQSGGSSGPGGRFRCPSCRHEVVLNRHGVYGLQRNLLVENIIDICTQHNRATTLSVNAAVSAKPRPLRLMCDEHPDEPINIYCCGCDTPTCSLCKVFGVHQDCDVAPLRQVYEEKQVEVSEGIAGLVAVNDQVQALISEMEKVCRTVEEQSRVCVDLVGRSLDGLILILDQKKQQLLSTIAAEEEQRLTHVRALTHAHTQKLQTGAQLVHRAVLTMDHQGHMATFIQVRGETS
uniref:Tripartite motif containing 54 n=1 Tax=Knipowitschia caucasica TaxID=637954 RepID=A0AAV2KCD3_KNICA